MLRFDVVVVASIVTQNPAQMRLAQDDHSEPSVIAWSYIALTWLNTQPRNRPRKRCAGRGCRHDGTEQNQEPTRRPRQSTCWHYQPREPSSRPRKPCTIPRAQALATEIDAGCLLSEMTDPPVAQKRQRSTGLTSGLEL